MTKQLNNEPDSQFGVLATGTCEMSGPNLSEFNFIFTPNKE